MGMISLSEDQNDYGQTKIQNRFENSRAFAEELDKQDPLAKFRERFYIPTNKGKSEIYLGGNSLGLQLKNSRSYVEEAFNEWKEKGVRGHFQGDSPWLPYHEFVNKGLMHITGALESEVVAMNSNTVNLNLCLVTFYRPTEERFKVITAAKQFPSDRYALQSHIELHNLDIKESLIEVQPRKGEDYIRTEDITATIKEHGSSVALVLMDGICYYNGQAYEMEKITKAAHKVGAYAGSDLAHAAGNLNLKLHDWNVDFAVWCSYKYLNSGPGAIGGCFINERHATNKNLPRLAGWWGNNKETRFQMGPYFDPIPTAEGWQNSNPSIFALAPLRASLQTFLDADISQLREKSVLLTGFLEYLIEENCSGYIRSITPKDPEQRGAQLSLRANTPKKGKAIYEKLEAAGVACDWREPDIIRVAPAPLYNTFTDVYNFAEMLSEFARQV